MALIPEDILGEIRHRADIVAVIGRHVELRKAGRNHKGLCPFHQEKTPSFNVNGDKGFFYCFGCQKKGDVFTFLMEVEGKSFLEAAEALAQQTGVTLPERSQDPAERRLAEQHKSERAQMLRINQAAASFFRQRLAEPGGRAARDYLAERGISSEMADRFQLGYAPDAWSELGDYLAGQKLSLGQEAARFVELAQAVGLVAPRQRSGGTYDRFRHRLTCPVVQLGGEVAGFSARALPGGQATGGKDGDGPAKYINSPESPVYKKSRLLYGLFQARDGIRQAGRAILVEGNFDVISMHQAGYSETVAPLGTALTEDQVLALRRLTERVVLLYDGDRAGRAATVKALRLLVAAGLDVQIALVPAGEDPDTLAQKGSDALAAVLDRARPGVEYFIYEVWSRTGQSATDYAAAVREAAEVLRSVADPVARDNLVGKLAVALDVGEDRLRSGLRQALRGQEAAAARTAGPTRASSGGPDEGNRDVRAAKPPTEETYLLALLGAHPELFPIAEELDVVSLLTDSRLRDMYSAARGGQPLWSCVPEDLSPDVAEHVLSGATRTLADPARELREAAANLRIARERARRGGLLRQIEQARVRGNHELARELSARAIEARHVRQPKE